MEVVSAADSPMLEITLLNGEKIQVPADYSKVISFQQTKLPQIEWHEKFPRMDLIDGPTLSYACLTLVAYVKEHVKIKYLPYSVEMQAAGEKQWTLALRIPCDIWFDECLRAWEKRRYGHYLIKQMKYVIRNVPLYWDQAQLSNSFAGLQEMMDVYAQREEDCWIILRIEPTRSIGSNRFPMDNPLLYYYNQLKEAEALVMSTCAEMTARFFLP